MLFSTFPRTALIAAVTSLLGGGVLLGCSNGGPGAAGQSGSGGERGGGTGGATGGSPGQGAAGGSTGGSNGSGGSTGGSGGSTSGSGGSTGGSGGSTQVAGTGGATTVFCPGDSTDASTVPQADGSEGAPETLSKAGLFQSDMQTLASGVRSFEPQYQLWADGATKRRWIWLPEGSQIDTTDMDFWQYPVGTRVFKEFSLDGVRVETRLLQKRPNGNWMRIAYQWRDDQTDADPTPCGLNDAHGTTHDIPASKACGTCHLRMPDKVIGFTAIQLAHDSTDPDAWTLARLASEGRLTNPPAVMPQVPGDETTRAALGYMHANCGFCHSPMSSVTSRISLLLWLQVGSLGDVMSTPTYRTSVGQKTLAEEGPPGARIIVDPGSPPTSSLFLRIDSRGQGYSMPPLATNEVDPTGVQTVQDWIVSLGSN